jgi:hypothetical protein
VAQHDRRPLARRERGQSAAQVLGRRIVERVRLRRPARVGEPPVDDRRDVGLGGRRDTEQVREPFEH